MTVTELIFGMISFILTVVVFSYLLGDNFLFRFGMYLLVGITAGYTAAVLITKVILPYLIMPLVEGSLLERLLLLVPLTFCILLLLALLPKSRKVGSISMAFIVGIGAALTVGGITIGTLIPQVSATVDRFSPFAIYQGDQPPWMKIVSGVIVALGVITSLSYFYWQKKRDPKSDNQKPAFMAGLGKLGQVFIGITLGGLFAGVYSAALIALISRIVDIKDFLAQLVGK